VDLALVLDMSGSTEDHHQLSLKLSRRLVDRLDVGRQTRVALLSFADHSTTHFNFNTYLTKEQVLSAINIIPSHGRTNTQAQLLLAFLCVVYIMQYGLKEFVLLKRIWLIPRYIVHRIAVSAD